MPGLRAKESVAVAGCKNITITYARIVICADCLLTPGEFRRGKYTRDDEDVEI